MNAERILIFLSALVVGVISADALAALPLREFGFMDCHFKDGLDRCSFSVRKLVIVVCNWGLSFIMLLCVVSHRHLRTMNRQED